MPEELLVLVVRYAAVILLLLAVALIFVRWRFPHISEEARRGRSYWAEFVRVMRKTRDRSKERAEDLRGIRGKSILVVDPDEKSSRVLVWKLESLGCRVTSAKTGREGIGSAPSVDVIISDALLPDISAVEFCQSISVPVVLIGVLGEQKTELNKLKNVACLGKPYDPEDAAAAAGRLLRGRSKVGRLEA